jgi:hypothetical protein
VDDAVHKCIAADRECCDRFARTIAARSLD